MSYSASPIYSQGELPMSNFLKKIFRKRGLPEPGEVGSALRVEDICRDVLGQNFTLITGRQTPVTIRRMLPGSFEHLSALGCGGLFYNTFSRSDSYPLSFFLSLDCADRLKTVFAYVHGEPVDRVSPVRICTWLDGNLSRLFYLEERKDTGLDDTWQVTPFLALPKTYNPEEKPEALWRFAGSELFCISSGEYEFFMLTDSARLGGVEKLLKLDAGFRRAVADQVMLRYTGGESRFFDREKSIRIRIEKNSEFLLGRFFIPLRPRIDGRPARTYYRAIVTSGHPGTDTGEDYTRFRLNFNFKDRVFEWYYSFHFSGIDEDRPRLKSIISGGMKTLKEAMNIHGVRGNFLNPNIYPDLSDHVCIEATIFLGNDSAVCRVFVDTEFLTTLAEYLLPPWEIDFLKRNLFVRMLSVISLNQTLFRKNIHSFYREKPLSLSASGTPRVIRVSELLNLVPPEDYRRIVQNFFLAQGWSVGNMQCLFFFERRTEEGEPVRIYMDSVFDSECFLASLPRTKRDEWNRSLIACVGWQDLVEHNLRAMLALYEAMEEDRISLSYPTRFLLKNEFQHRIEEDYNTEINKLAGNRLYIDQLSELPPSLAQGVLSRFPLDRLALALITDSSDRIILDTFISKKKRIFLDEEIDFRKERFNKGEINPRDVFKAMTDLRKAVGDEYGEWLNTQEKD